MTKFQCIRGSRKTYNHYNRFYLLPNRPQRKGICEGLVWKAPKKPNSARRTVGEVSFYNLEHPQIKRLYSCYLPGGRFGLQKHSVVLIQGGRTSDVPGLIYKIIRNKYDVLGPVGRYSSRSKYGVPLVKPRSHFTTIKSKLITELNSEFLRLKAEEKDEALHGFRYVKIPALFFQYSKVDHIFSKGGFLAVKDFYQQRNSSTKLHNTSQRNQLSKVTHNYIAMVKGKRFFKKTKIEFAKYNLFLIHRYIVRIVNYQSNLGVRNQPFGKCIAGLGLIEAFYYFKAFHLSNIFSFNKRLLAFKKSIKHVKEKTTTTKGFYLTLPFKLFSKTKGPVSKTQTDLYFENLEKRQKHYSKILMYDQKMTYKSEWEDVLGVDRVERPLWLYDFSRLTYSYTTGARMFPLGHNLLQRKSTTSLVKTKPFKPTINLFTQLPVRLRGREFVLSGFEYEARGVLKLINSFLTTTYPNNHLATNSSIYNNKEKKINLHHIIKEIFNIKTINLDSTGSVSFTPSWSSYFMRFVASCLVFRCANFRESLACLTFTPVDEPYMSLYQLKLLWFSFTTLTFMSQQNVKVQSATESMVSRLFFRFSFFGNRPTDRLQVAKWHMEAYSVCMGLQDRLGFPKDLNFFKESQTFQNFLLYFERYILSGFLLHYATVVELKIFVHTLCEEPFANICSAFGIKLKKHRFITYEQLSLHGSGLRRYLKGLKLDTYLLRVSGNTYFKNYKFSTIKDRQGLYDWLRISFHFKGKFRNIEEFREGVSNFFTRLRKFKELKEEGNA